MRNSIRVTEFIIAFLATVVLYSLVLPAFDFFYLTDLHYIQTGLALILVCFPGVLAIARMVHVNRNYNRGKFFFATSLHPRSKWRHRFIFWALLAAVLYTPIVKDALAITITQAVISTAVWMILIEGLLYITYNTTKAHFMTDGIIVRGIDFRPDFPIGDPYRSNSEIYPYHVFACFVLDGNHMKLIMKNREGVLNILLPEDKIQHIASYVAAKDIPRRHAHEVDQMK